MNQAGINFVVTELNHVMNKFIPQSNLSSKQVENYILSYSSRVRTALVQNSERFKIKNLSDLTQIKGMIVDTAFFILQQPIDDKGRKFIFAPIKQVESHSFQENNTQQSRHKLGW
jgi:hypothetical protein